MWLVRWLRRSHHLSDIVYVGDLCAELLSNDLRGREKKYFMFLNDLWFSSSHSQFYQRRQEGFTDLSLQTVGSSCLQCHMTILSGHWTSASPYVKWKCEEDKKSCVFRRSVLKHRCLCVCVRGWGLESGCRFAVGLFLFLFLVSKLHKAGALLRRIWCRKAQATLKIQSSKENRKIKRKNGYHS